MTRIARIELAGQQQYGGEPFPLALACESADLDLATMSHWLQARREELLAASATHGAVLFRGFPLQTPQDFDAFVAAFDLPNFPYEESLSNAVRIVKTPRVFTANEAPPSVTIFLHHEMAQTPIYPSRLFFFCEQPAAEGGATPLCRSDVLWEIVESEFPSFADCIEKGLRYSNVMPAENDLASGMGRSWQSTLRASSRDQVESRLSTLGYSWEWLPGDNLRATTPVLPAVRKLADGRTTFFNQLIAAFSGWKDARNDPAKAITFGDGTPLDPEAVRVAAWEADKRSFDVPWQRGDVALVDNFVTMHGRRTFSGTRKVLASLIA
jgi:hypothetical protein